jgi:subtilisin family serine protease
MPALRKTSIDNLAGKNIATVIASGNEGFTDAVGAPGCISTAVTVGSVTKSDTVSDFSNSAPMVDLLAPGSRINSSVLGDLFGTMSGTSMATPHVAGAFAALSSKAADKSVAEILDALESTGQPITDSRNSLTKPRIDVKAALDALVPRTQPISAVGCTLCYSCGGQWPVFGGAIPTRQGANPYERGEQCSGEPIPRADTLPYLCCAATP